MYYLIWWELKIIKNTRFEKNQVKNSTKSDKKFFWAYFVEKYSLDVEFSLFLLLADFSFIEFPSKIWSENLIAKFNTLKAIKIENWLKFWLRVWKPFSILSQRHSDTFPTGLSRFIYSWDLRGIYGLNHADGIKFYDNCNKNRRLASNFNRRANEFELPEAKRRLPFSTVRDAFQNVWFINITSILTFRQPW